MARRNATSVGHVLRVGMQVFICAAGLLAGLIAGAAIVYYSGLWLEFAAALKTPFDAMTKVDLMVVAATVVIVFGCAWVGVRWGMTQAARIAV